MNKNIFFFPTHATSLAKFLDLAPKLLNKNYSFYFVVANQYVFDQKHRIESLGFNVIKLGEYKKKALRDGKESVGINSDEYGYIKKIITKFVRLLFWMNITTNFKEVLFEWRFKRKLLKEYKHKQKQVLEMLNNIKPDLLIVADDRCLGYQCILQYEVKKNGCKIIIPPISTFSDPVKIAENRKKNNPFCILMKPRKIKKNLLQQYITLETGEIITFYDTRIISVLSKLSYLPCNPWVLGASLCDVVMVNGQYERKRLINYGMDERKVIVTGDPELDLLFEMNKEKTSIRECLYKEHSFDSDQKLMVLALPQLYEHKIVDFQTHWTIIYFILNEIEKHKVNLLISLHPKMKLEDYSFLEEKYNLSISKKPLRDIISTADIYIASQSSSTWFWSVALEIPCILTNWYDMNYELENKDCGVFEARLEKEFSNELNRIINNPKYYKSLCRKQKIQSQNIVMFDGNSVNNISKVITSHLS